MSLLSNRFFSAVYISRVDVAAIGLHETEQAKGDKAVSMVETGWWRCEKVDVLRRKASLPEPL